MAVALAALLTAMVCLYLDMTVDQMQLNAPRVSTTAVPGVLAAGGGCQSLECGDLSPLLRGVGAEWPRPRLAG